MNWNNTRLIYLKEIQGAIRDRRTLISMIVIPLIFYPLLFLVIGYFSVLGQKNSEAQPSAINIIGEANATQLVTLLKQDKDIEIISSESEANPEHELMEGSIHLTIQIPDMVEENYAGESKTTPKPIIIEYDSTAQRSQTARKRVLALLEHYREGLIRVRLNKIGLESDFLEPFQEQWLDLAPQEKKVGFLLGSILPHFIIILIFVGAMHSAVDITAGEKERGTMATLLVSQLSRLEIVLGKYFSVMTISAVSMFLGLIGLSIALLVPALLLGETFLAGVHFSTTIFFLFLLTLIPLVGLASSILILIGIFARNNREASTYITPIYMIAIFLAMISLSQGIELAKPLFLIPILNNSFVFKELLIGTIDKTHLFNTVVSNLLLALLALRAATRMFQQENVLFRS
ncbi:MAG TPA: ABC transporter permease subunit [Atribacterota bacterium]|nr:ABC transporter permease subunit [Atribacterota bacterium]